ncbi:MAG: hypothetical protein WKG00_11155 [Polyangiaceae bacterium]
MTRSHPGEEGGSDESLLLRAGVRPRVSRIWVVAGVSTLVGVGLVAIFVARRGPEAPADAAPGLVSPAGTSATATATVAAEAPSRPGGTAAAAGSGPVIPAATQAPRSTPVTPPTSQAHGGRPPPRPTSEASAPKPPGELRENPYGTP